MKSVDKWESTKEEIRDRVDFVGIVEEYLNLEKKGKSYWGLCPFHSEDTPSFSVTPEMGIFKCFGCGEGGDLFDFYMEIEACGFREAMERLSERCGVELPERESTDENDLRTRLFEINEYCEKKYAQVFWEEIGSDAREYMFNRGFKEAVLKQFNIGYAPDGWSNMKQALKRDGYDLGEAGEAGILGTGDGGRTYDKFRDRVIFPIKNRGGRTVGFGGRLLNEESDLPKYLNSPESPVFSKRSTLYGITEARDSIREAGYALVMEGYTDVIRCHQEGFSTAVATLGTALTEQHARLLKRFADEIVFVYDGDNAGKRAARRGGEKVIPTKLNASVVLLPEGKDPADVLLDEQNSFSQMVDNRTPYIEALLNWLKQEVSTEKPEGKEKILEEMAPVITGMQSDIRKQDVIQSLSGQLGLSADLVRESIQNIQDQTKSSRKSQVQNKIKERTGTSIEEVFFRSLAVNYDENPDQFSRAVDLLSVTNFRSKRSKRLMKALNDILEDDQQFSVDLWLEEVPDQYRNYLAGLLSWDDYMKFAEGTDPVKIARKIRQLDSSRHERNELEREIFEYEKEGQIQSLDETKRNLLREIIENKSKEENSTRNED